MGDILSSKMMGEKMVRGSFERTVEEFERTVMGAGIGRAGIGLAGNQFVGRMVSPIH